MGIKSSGKQITQQFILALISCVSASHPRWRHTDHGSRCETVNESPADTAPPLACLWFAGWSPAVRTRLLHDDTTEPAPRDRGNRWWSRPESTEQTNCSLISVIYLLEEHSTPLIFSTLDVSDLLHQLFPFWTFLTDFFRALIGSKASLEHERSHQSAAFAPRSLSCSSGVGDPSGNARLPSHRDAFGIHLRCRNVSFPVGVQSCCVTNIGVAALSWKTRRALGVFVTRATIMCRLLC